MHKILIATTNQKKTEKFKDILKRIGKDYLTLNEISQKIEIEETGESFEENAILKTISWSKVVPYITLATDAGAIIPSLGNKWNGLFTHRFTEKNATSKEKIEALFSMMTPFTQEEERKVIWQENLAIAQNGKLLAS